MKIDIEEGLLIYLNRRFGGGRVMSGDTGEVVSHGMEFHNQFWIVILMCGVQKVRSIIRKLVVQFMLMIVGDILSVC